MKKIFLLIVALTGAIAFAQAPQGFSYQAVAFDNDGKAVEDTAVSVRISIIDESVNGTELFSEIHNPTTNTQGLFSLSIGMGTNVTGNFNEINWGKNNKFIKLEIDITGGSNYVNVGTSQLMSVPYALYAENSNNTFWKETHADTISLKDTGKIVKVNTVDVANGSLHVSELGEGIVLTSPNGTKYKLSISDSGGFSIVNNTTGEVVDNHITNPVSSGQVIELNGSYTTDLDLDPINTYIITGGVVIEDGVTLTIPAGMTIKARKGPEVYLAIAQGGKIKAEGTAAEPIVFTSNAASPNSGDWGGLVILGKAPINSVDGSTVTTRTAEIASLPYGGDLSDDNSGILSYVRVEYTGGKVDGQLENNAVTLYGVGSGTSINHIQVYETSDDAFEFYGGTVNVSFISTINVDDDCIDWTEGYTGSLSDIYIRQSLDGDKAFECDGYNTDYGNNSNPIYFSSPTISNVTILGVGSGLNREAIRLRAGTRGVFNNMLISGYGEAFDIDGDLVNNPTGEGVVNGFLKATNVKFFDITLKVKNDTGVSFSTSDFVTENNAATGTNFDVWGAGWARN